MKYNTIEDLPLEFQKAIKDLIEKGHIREIDVQELTKFELMNWLLCSKLGKYGWYTEIKDWMQQIGLYVTDADDYK